MKNHFHAGKLIGLIAFIFLFSVLPFSVVAQQKFSAADQEIFDQAAKALGNGSYDTALGIFDSLLKKLIAKEGPNSLLVAKVYNNLGATKWMLGLYESAISYYEKALPIYEAGGEPELKHLASVHQNLGMCFSALGDIEKAMTYYENSERIFQKLKLSNQEVTELLYLNLSVHFLETKNIAEAEKYNRKSFEINRNSPYSFKKWNVLALILNGKKDYENSILNLNKAIEIGEKDLGDKFAEKGLIYMSLGMVYLEMEDFEHSLANYLIAKDLIEKRIGTQGVSYASCLKDLGLNYLRKKENESNLSSFLVRRKKNLEIALDYFQKAIIAISPGFKPTDNFSNPEPENSIDKLNLLDALKNKAEALSLLAQLEEKQENNEAFLRSMESALATFDLSVKTIHLVRNGLQNQASRLYLTENERPVYSDALNVAVRLYEKTGNRYYFEKGFEFSERSRSANFQAMLSESNAKEFSGLPDSLRLRETEIKKEISAYENFIFNEKGSPAPDQKKINLWKDKVFSLNQSYQEMMRVVEKEFPRYYQYKYADPVVSVKKVQQSLDNREALIEYFIHEGRKNEPAELYTFVITDHEYRLLRRPLGTLFDNSVNHFLHFIRDGMVLNTHKAQYIQYSKNASYLYKQLVEPVTAAMQNYRLIIVPDDVLSYIPFDALLASEADTTRMDFRKLDYLVHHHAISYTYSATLLYHYFQNNLKYSDKLAAFAPDYDPNTASAENLSEQLVPLPGAAAEVAGVTDLITGDKFTGTKATKKIFLQNAEKYDILHLAMHTILNDTLPLYSKMVFSPDGPGKEERTLNTYEIYNLKLRSGMVVLSGCNTGSGKLQKGEGVMSLARAFLYAGCPSIIMTLWNVEDVSSSFVMVEFYRNIKNGFSKDEALRRAKESYILQADPMKSHPYFWLGYVSIGKQAPLFKSKAGYFVGLIIFVFLAIVLEKWYFKRRKRISRLK